MKKLLLLVVVFLPLLAQADVQEEWMNKLSYCESRGRDYITVLDSNNKYSYSLYQFQLDTFYGFGKEYGIFPPEMEKWEAKLLIYNPNIQTAIARRMLDNGLSYHWKNCTNKIGPYPLTSV